MRHLEQVELDPSRLARRREGAARIGDAGSALRTDLADLHLDPTRWRLQRAAKAARQAEQYLAGVEQQIANVVACEIENDFA